MTTTNGQIVIYEVKVRNVTSLKHFLWFPQPTYRSTKHNLSIATVIINIMVVDIKLYTIF